MTLLITEINEIRQMMDNLDAGTVSPEDFNAKMGGYAQIEKRERLLLSAWALSIKAGTSGDGKHIVDQLIGRKTIEIKKPIKSRTANRGK